MTSHTIDIQTQVACTPEGEPTAMVRYRWRCSCGDLGRWHASATESGSVGRCGRAARNGGARHVAAMERSK